jgi:L-asparaginase
VTKKKKKVLLILTGGTFGMSEGLPVKSLKPIALDGNLVLEAVPEIAEFADIDWVSIFNLDSSDISPRHWENIGKTISDYYRHYDGFVIIHGTDTMVYSATATSFMMKGSHKPVVFTGSQRPLKKIRTDAKSNLINAVEFATYDIPEVTIAFNNKLLRGNRAKKVSIENYDAFFSYNFPPLGTVGLNVEVRYDLLRDSSKPSWRLGFDARIALIKLYPGMKASLLKQSLLGGEVKGVILEGFGSGHIPEFDESWLNLISELKDNGIPTIITSQCPHGFVDLSRYDNGAKALKVGAISCGDITSEAAVVKLMFAMDLFNSYDEAIDFMTKNYCGELSYDNPVDYSSSE